MRLLSNLYKQQNIITNSENARVINSNEKVAQKMRGLSMEAVKKARSNGTFGNGLSPELLETMQVEEPEVSMDEIREEARRLIEEAREQARGIIDGAEVQADNIKNQAQKDGYQQGFAKATAEVDIRLKQQEEVLQERANQVEEDYLQKLKEMEPLLVDVVADVFERVFHVQFDDKKEILLYLIQNTILNVEGSREFQIKVCQQNYQFLQNHKAEILERVGQNVTLEILADPYMKENQCMIEADSGVFDCSLGVQLENLVKTIRSLSL